MSTELDRAVASLVAGRSVLVEIAGGSGSGRSALLRCAVAAARRSGAAVLHVTGVAGVGAAAVVGDVLAQVRLEGAESVPGSAHVWPAASSAVLALARTRPVVVAVDDGHRLDLDVREWLTVLARRGAGTSLMIVVVSDGVQAVLDGAVVVTPCPPGGHEVIGDAVARSVCALPVEAAALLRAIAVCGPAFDLELTRALVELGDWTVSRALDALVGAGLLTADGKPTAPVDRLLDGMVPHERQELCARAARLGHRCAVDPLELARIVGMAPPLGESWVVRVLRCAARHEADRDDPAAAVRHLERALREPVDARTRAELTLELAVTESRYAPDAADQRLARMLLEPRSGDCVDARLAAADQLQARGDAVLARRTFGAVRATGVERCGLEALFWLTDDVQREFPELSLLDVEPLPLRPDDPERAGAAAWEAVSRGQDIELARSLARFALVSPAVSLFSQVIACASLVFADDLQEAIAGMDRVLATARDRHLSAMAGLALVFRARANFTAGHYEDAARDLEASAAQRPNWHPHYRPMMVSSEILISLGRGLVDRAREFDASVSDSEWGPGYTWTSYLFASAVLALQLGDLDRAIERLEECGRRWRPGQVPNPAPLPWRGVAAIAYRARGDIERATELCRDELTLAQRWGAPVSTARSHLACAAVLGDQRHLTSAVELLRHRPLHGVRATALLDLAETLDPVSAAPLVREAAHIATRGGAVVLIDRARNLGWVPGSC